jgi:hypothetical protein
MAGWIDRWRGRHVTKMQIAAKSLLTGLIVYAVISLPRPLTELPYYLTAENTPLAVFLLVVCVALLVAAGLYIVAVGNRLLPGNAADDEILAPDRARRLLAQALRLTMVLVGLVLLPESLPTIAAILKLPFVLRGIISDAIADPGLLSASTAQWFRRIYEFARLLLVLYLLCGAPRLVRWQIARAEGLRSTRPNESERLGHG